MGEWVISKFNGTSTPKGSYRAKTDSSRQFKSLQSKNWTVWEHLLSGQVWTKCPTSPDTQGVPRGGCSLHPSALWDLTDVNNNRFYVAWREAIRRVWKILPQITHCVLLPIICNDLPIEVQMCKRFLKILISLSESYNCIVKTIFCGPNICMTKQMSVIVNLMFQQNWHLRKNAKYRPD